MQAFPSRAPASRGRIKTSEHWRGGVPNPLDFNRKVVLYDKPLRAKIHRQMRKSERRTAAGGPRRGISRLRSRAEFAVGRNQFSQLRGSLFRTNSLAVNLKHDIVAQILRGLLVCALTDICACVG